MYCGRKKEVLGADEVIARQSRQSAKRFRVKYTGRHWVMDQFPKLMCLIWVPSDIFGKNRRMVEFVY